MLKPVKSYKEAGVDIEKGDRFADFIKSIPSKAINKGLGSFAGGIPLDVKKYKEPVLLTCTDGVGTKLLVAKKLNDYTTIGQDLVAMCVNDLVVCGAEPLVFLDYMACGKIEEEKLQTVIKSIVEACEMGESELSGGETAEMPDMYDDGEIDLAGFSVGIAEKTNLLPKKEKLEEGDVILGLPSSGVHSNGLSLARKIITEDQIENRKKLLAPTRIYVKEMKALLKTGKILSAAHITGGGLEGNIVRGVSDHLKPELTYDWEKPEIFDIMQKQGNISEEEMRKVFNLGIGLTVIVKKADKDVVISAAKEAGFEIKIVGKLIKK